MTAAASWQSKRATAHQSELAASAISSLGRHAPLGGLAKGWQVVSSQFRQQSQFVAIPKMFDQPAKQLSNYRNINYARAVKVKSGPDQQSTCHAG